MDKAVELYKIGKVRYLLTTSGTGFYNFTSISLAKRMKEYLVRQGVGEQDILIESESNNTFENALYSLKIIKEKKFKSVMVVTSADHMRRAKKIFQKLYPRDIKLELVISDYFSGLWSVWDFFWHLAGSVKDLFRR